MEALNQVEVVTLLNLHCQYTYGSQVIDSMVCAIGSFNQGICIVTFIKCHNLGFADDFLF